MSLENQDRDLLITLSTKVDYIKEGVDHLKGSDARQWDKIDNHGNRLSCHEEGIGTLKRFLFILAGAFVSSVVGTAIAFIVNKG